jgi:hypothetical protein
LFLFIIQFINNINCAWIISKKKKSERKI